MGYSKYRSKKNINEKLSQLKSYAENKRDLFVIINIIENINNKNIDLDEKYEEIKVCFDLIKVFERKVAIFILELITLVIN